MNYDDLRAKALAATPGPWCYESCGEKGDGANIIGIAFGPDDNDCKRPLFGRLPEWDDAGNEIEYYRDERIATCEHSDRNSGRNADFIAAANPETILALLDELAALRADAERYRYMRVGNDDLWIELRLDDGWRFMDGTDLDAAIDRARTQGGDK